MAPSIDFLVIGCCRTLPATLIQGTGMYLFDVIKMLQYTLQFFSWKSFDELAHGAGFCKSANNYYFG
jgi:hypothetical protein